MAMHLRLSPHPKPETVARACALRRDMTDAELALWRGIRESLPEGRFRSQVPLGPFYADFASHRCRLVIELDGSQHGEKLDYDAARTHFMNGEGYRVLRFWNNEVLGNLDGVLTVISNAVAQLPSPLVGVGWLFGSSGGRTCHLSGGAKRRMGGARRSRARASGPPPHAPPSPGEGAARRSRARA